MKLGEQSAILMAHHNSFVMIVNAALGGETKDSKAPTVHDPGVKDMGAGHGSVEDAVASIMRSMTF